MDRYPYRIVNGDRRGENIGQPCGIHESRQTVGRAKDEDCDKPVAPCRLYERSDWTLGIGCVEGVVQRCREMQW